MKRLIAPFAVAAVALAPGTAIAGHSRAKVYKGTFDFVGADGDYVTGKFGKAQLVDGPRNDKLSVHVRRLAPKTTYTFRLQQSAVKACRADAPGGTDVPGWKYRNGGVLKTNRKGIANSKATSRSFRASRRIAYFVGVYGPDGKLVLCADLHTKKKGKAKSEDKGKSRGKDKGKRGDKPSGNAQGNGRPESPGKSGDAPGRAEDKQRGKSGDAPRGRGRDKD